MESDRKLRLRNHVTPSAGLDHILDGTFGQLPLSVQDEKRWGVLQNRKALLYGGLFEKMGRSAFFGKRKQTGSILPKTAELRFSKAALTRSGFSGVALLSGRFSETGRLADLSPVLPQ